MKKILKKNINIKKQIKINYLSTFLNNSQYIFIINDLSLKSQQFLDKFKNEFVNLNKIVIKSKLLIILPNTVAIKNCNGFINLFKCFGSLCCKFLK